MGRFYVSHALRVYDSSIGNLDKAPPNITIVGGLQDCSVPGVC